MCKNGIQKINIGTELYMSSVNAVMNNIENLSKSPYLVYEKIVEEYKNVALKWIDLCGTKNRS
jgi:fructose/tagatose bisphosphate aldolase